MTEPNKAMEALCQSAGTSYRGSLTPAALLSFLRTGVVESEWVVQLEYAIEELPVVLWSKAIADHSESEQVQMREVIAAYAKTRRLYLPPETTDWLMSGDVPPPMA